MSDIWDGKGCADGTVWFTKDNGEIVGRPYVRRRVSAGLSRFFPLSDRRAALAKTVDSDAWLRWRNGSTVSSLLRDADNVLWGGPL